MDLTTRALLLAGMIVGLFVLAGLALVIGRSMVSDNNGESFDVGKGRKKKRKKPSKKQVQAATAAAAAPAMGTFGAQAPEPAGYMMGAAATASGQTPFGTPQPSPAAASAPPFPPAVAEALPQVSAAPPSGGASPFGGAAPTEEEW